MCVCGVEGESVCGCEESCVCVGVCVCGVRGRVCVCVWS